MSGINKLLTFVAVTLCFFTGAIIDSFWLMLLSVVISLAALVLEHYALPRFFRHVRPFRNF